MASKRKLNFSDVASVEEPADSASVHGVVTLVSPVHKSKRGTGYFNATLSDGTTSRKVVGFREAQQIKMKELMDKRVTICLDDCQVKKSQRGSDMEILLKRMTSISPSPKKFKVDLSPEEEMISLEEIKRKDEYEKVSVKIKVLEVKEPITVSSGKKVQDVVVGDENSTSRCTLWENDIGELTKGKSYHLKRFTVKEYESNNYLPKGQDAVICAIDDIGSTATFDEPEHKLTTITAAQIVGVPQIRQVQELSSVQGKG